MLTYTQAKWLKVTQTQDAVTSLLPAYFEAECSLNLLSSITQLGYHLKIFFL